MGCCCSQHTKDGAFRQDLGVPLLEEIAPKLAGEAKVVVVRLSCLRDIKIGNSYSGLSDAYVELKLLPEDPVVGLQKQYSSIKPGSLSPKWEPPERFQFVVSKPNDARIVLSVLHYNSANPDEHIGLGDSQLKVKDISNSILQIIQGAVPSANPSNNTVTKVVKLVSPIDGKAAGEAEFLVSILSLTEACNVQEHTVYEFQRWNPVQDWGNSDPPGHLLITDPGRWSSEDGKRFGKDMESVSPPVPSGWDITKSWRTYGSDEDPEGWQYSTTFESPYWYPQNQGSGYVVRRRTWHREIRKGDSTTTTTSSITTDKSSNSVDKGAGRRKRMFSSDKKK